MNDVVIGLDAGGTKLLGGLVGRDGTVLERHHVLTPRSSGRCDPGLAMLHELASGLAVRAADSGHRVHGVGLGIAEYVRDGQLTSAEVFDWQRQPDDLLGHLAGGGVVAVDADVRCAAAAESAVRRLSDRDPMVYVSWGTGLSSTLVIGGRCLAGSRGEALALGEWPVESGVDPTWAGNLDHFASGLGIAERYATRTSRALSGAQVAQRAARGDPDARLVVESAAGAVARAVAALVLVVDPAVVVLGGGVGTGGGVLATQVREMVPRLLARPDAPPVEAARVGADAGLLGAGLRAWQTWDRSDATRRG